MGSRLNMVVKDEVFNRFESERSTLGLSRPAFIEYILCKKTDKGIKPILYKELISSVSELNLLLKALIISEKVSSSMEVLSIFEQIKRIEEKLQSL